MKRTPDRKWSARIVARYTLFQLPGVAVVTAVLLILQKWADLAGWIVWCLVGLWVAKDAVFYPFVWKAYDWNRTEDINPMIGAEAIARERLDPSGYVEIRGERWRAEVQQGGSPVEKGERVRIYGIHGLILLVKPDGEEGDKS